MQQFTNFNYIHPVQLSTVTKSLEITLLSKKKTKTVKSLLCDTKHIKEQQRTCAASILILVNPKHKTKFTRSCDINI